MTFTDNRPKKKWYMKLINWMKNNLDLIIPSILISFTNILCCVVIAKMFAWVSVNLSEYGEVFLGSWLLINCFPVWYLLSKIRDRN